MHGKSPNQARSYQAHHESLFVLVKNGSMELLWGKITFSSTTKRHTVAWLMPSILPILRCVCLSLTVKSFIASCRLALSNNRGWLAQSSAWICSSYLSSFNHLGKFGADRHRLQSKTCCQVWHCTARQLPLPILYFTHPILYFTQINEHCCEPISILIAQINTLLLRNWSGRWISQKSGRNDDLGGARRAGRQRCSFYCLLTRLLAQRNINL